MCESKGTERANSSTRSLSDKPPHCWQSKQSLCAPVEMELVTATASARGSTLLEEERCTLEWVATARTILRGGIIRIIAVIESLS